MSYKKFQRIGNARHYLRPYTRLYYRLKQSAKRRGIELKLSYEQYCRIIKNNPKCSYCNKKLTWTKHGNDASAINLDRRSNKGSYNIRNVVASCPRCNRARGFGFSYKEWFNMTKYFRG